MNPPFQDLLWTRRQRIGYITMRYFFGITRFLAPFTAPLKRDETDMVSLLLLINTLVDIYIWSLVIYVASSWLIAFRIVNPWQPAVRFILQFLDRIHEPIMGRIRSVLPDLGGIDISPIIVLLAVQFLRNLLNETLLGL